ncbi:hypothetical protein GDO81_014644 [Engystomops pustulosus]|uniref:Uncharacterized protein n=1 Tax=Engystomops pustulosus TaxID=76066 RepID=A0AAV7BBQ6_ENGPU|nr:hypothetical protein GDO81_014644 [Engystomops pustulosus]
MPDNQCHCPQLNDVSACTVQGRRKSGNTLPSTIHHCLHFCIVMHGRGKPGTTLPSNLCHCHLVEDSWPWLPTSMHCACADITNMRAEVRGRAERLTFSHGRGRRIKVVCREHKKCTRKR